MYQITKGEHNPVNFFAGDFPIVTDVGTVKANATIPALSPIIETEDGLTVVTAAGVEAGALVGIAAAEPESGEIVYYLTGEFFADALVLPNGVTAETLKPAFRKLSIFLK